MQNSHYQEQTIMSNDQVDDFIFHPKLESYIILSRILLYSYNDRIHIQWIVVLNINSDNTLMGWVFPSSDVKFIEYTEYLSMY